LDSASMVTAPLHYHKKSNPLPAMCCILPLNFPIDTFKKLIIPKNLL